MPGIFVSYRRDDSQGFAGRLADDLDDILGPEHVFRDVEIPIGSDFTHVLNRAIAASDILLVVIGRHWAAESDQGHGSRLFEPTDWVRAEIEAAFAQGKDVVPVLVGDADMPDPESLPQSIVNIARQQAAILTDRHWDADVARLVARLRKICPSLAQERSRTDSTDESPATVLRELRDRILDEVKRRRPKVHRASQPSGLPRRTVRRIGGGLRTLFTIAVLLGMIYVGIRLFGDETLLRNLDAFEARLRVGWERLLNYIVLF